MLSVPALLVWHIREKGPPPRESSLGGSQAEDLDPVTATLRIDTEMPLAQGKTWERKAAPRDRETP